MMTRVCIICDMMEFSNYFWLNYSTFSAAVVNVNTK
jgi:hypothetical protein